MKIEPGVSTQPPAGNDLHVEEDNNILCHNCVVVINMGSFDIPVKEFRSRGAAEIYYLQFRALCLSHIDVKIKSSDNVRYLQETFVKDDICTGIDLMKSQVLQSAGIFALFCLTFVPAIEGMLSL